MHPQHEQNPFRKAQERPITLGATPSAGIPPVTVDDSDIVRALVQRVDGHDEVLRGLYRSVQSVLREREDAMNLLGPHAPARLRRPPSVGMASKVKRGERLITLIRLLRMNGPTTAAELHRWLASAWQNTTKKAGTYATTYSTLQRRTDLFVRIGPEGRTQLFGLKEQTYAIDRISEHGADGAEVLSFAYRPRGRAGQMAPDPTPEKRDRVEPGGGVPGPV